MFSNFRAAVLAAALFWAAAPSAFAQGNPPGNPPGSTPDSSAACLAPDSILVRGTVRTSANDAFTHTGLVRGVKLSSFLDVQKALKGLFATGDYDAAVGVNCEYTTTGKVWLVFTVHERPLLGSIKIVGPKSLTQQSVEDRVELLLRRPVDPGLVTRAVTRIDSMYDAAGYVFAKVVPETTVVSPGVIGMTFRVTEGRRTAVSGLTIVGNKGVSASEIASAMATKVEGLLWFQKGEFDADRFAADVGDSLPRLYASLGYLDFRVDRDTVIIDRERGKAQIEIDVNEGPQYHLGTFAIGGNQHFTEEQLRRYYPFADDGLTISQRALNLVRGKRVDPTVFDYSRWDDATKSVSDLYSNDGYVYAQVDPILERSRRGDSVHVVNMRWQVDEHSPAMINRIEITGNDYTSENCIRDMVVAIPGDVFNKDRLLRSYRGLGNLGFFETPIAPPETPIANEHNDLNVVFSVKEKRTGNINFGASTGQGVGIGGFIGLEQPNLFGRCKRGSVNWQFGKFQNDFNLTYTDPAIELSRYSGTVNLYRSQARYTIADLGQNTRTGGTLRFGVPVRGALYTRFFVSYTGEGVSFGNTGLLGTIDTTSNCKECFRSAIGLDLTRDSRAGMPFPFAGSLQTLSAQFNGGPLGGSADFQRYTGEYRAFTTLAEFGGSKAGSTPLFLVLGGSARAGAVFGNTGPFFFSQRFAMGGVQFGEPLRGYPEFSITPAGFLTGTSTYNASRASFGSAFFASTIEVGLRFNEQFYVNVFYDAGNVWESPRDFDPTRLFRGSGVGISTVTPLGPLGLDLGYGFDRLDINGRRDPKWQLHFRLGQLF